MALGSVKWSDTDKTSVFNLSSDKLTVSGTSSSVRNMMRANTSKSKGKRYWEVKINSASGSAFGFGVANKDLSLSAGATDTKLRIYWATGVKYPTNVAYGASFTTGDVISILLDLDNGTLEFWKNGVSQGVAFTDIALLGNDIFPLIRLFTATIDITTNFGETDFVYTMPQGFTAYGWVDVNKILILSGNETITSVKRDDGNKTIVEIPALLEQNFINHGMDKSTELDLSAEMTNKIFVEQSSTSLGNGKVFRKSIDTTKTPIKKMSIE